jgi:hypothetical protein
MAPQAISEIISTVFVRVRTGILKELSAREVAEYLVNSQQRFDGRFGVVFSYEFSDEELNRAQTLLNDLRDEIAASEQFEPKHKARILSKLEGLQKELHKNISNLDKFWGLIGEAGIVFGKFGEDVKPLVDRMAEVAKIAYEVQARAEGLSRTPALTFLKTDDKKIEHDEE